MPWELVVAVAAALVGLGLAILIGRAFLGALLKATFHRARTIVRRLVDRRSAPRTEPDRRQADRRH
jgi:hypothetical protein